MDIIKQAVKSGAIGYLVKQVGAAQLIPAIKIALSRVKELQNSRGGLVKNSARS